MNTVELDRIDPPAEITITKEDEEFCRLRVEHGWPAWKCYDLSHPSQHGQDRSHGALAVRGNEIMQKPGIRERMKILRDKSEDAFVMSFTEKRIKLAQFAREGLEKVLDDQGMIDQEKLRHLPVGAIAKLKSTAVTRRVKVADNEYEDETTVTTELALRDPLKAIEIDNKMAGHNAAEEHNLNMIPLEYELDQANNKAKQLPSADEMKEVDNKPESVEG